MTISLLEKIIHIYAKPARVAILMSGKGSNADVILRNVHRYPNLNFITICTDSNNSNAYRLSQRYNKNYYCLNAYITTPATREAYFQELAAYLSMLKIDGLIYAGFMKISTANFVRQFPGINVHPADLTLCDASGKPKYIGMHAIQNAIKNGETYLASTAHVVDSEVDCGSPIMLSKPLSLAGKDTNDIYAIHEELKINCEHTLYPYLLECLSRGNIKPQATPYFFNE